MLPTSGADLLVCATRLSPDPALLQGLLRQPIDWTWTLAAARAHGVLPVLWRQLDSLRQFVPPDAQARLREDAQDIARRNLALVGELLQLSELLTSHHIPFLALKGPALALLAYGDPALRQFRDLDILVRRSDVTRAGDLLTARGYRPRLQLTPAREAAFRAAFCEHEFARPDGMLVELHWAFFPRAYGFSLRFEEALARGQPVRLGGSIVQTLGPEDLLVYLCAHGTYHRWVRLEWIVDVARLAGRAAAIDWSQVLERARALSAARMLRLGLLLARDLFAVRLPERVTRDLLGDRAAVSLASNARRRLFLHPAGLEGVWAAHWYHVQAHDRLRDRVACLGRALITLSPRDWALVPLPDWLYPLYYLIRPLRLAAKYAKRALSRERPTS